MPKKNKKKQFKSGKKVVKTTPAEKEIIENEATDLDEKEDSKNSNVEEVSNEKSETTDTNKEVNESNKSKSKAEKKVEKLSKKAEKIENKNKNKKRWFKDFKAELKKVIWPTGKELFDNTVVVIAMVVIVSLLIFVLDLAFESLSKLEVSQLNNVKTSITSENVSDENSTNTTTDESNDANATAEQNALEILDAVSNENDSSDAQ